MSTGLQTCAKVLQIQISGGGGTPWMQPKSNVTFKLALYNLFSFLVAYFAFNFIHYSVHCAHRIANLLKMLQTYTSRRGGTHWMQPKINVTFKFTLYQLFRCLAAYFGFNCFHYSGHCVHRIANLCKSAANTDFRGWGDTLDATQK